tara:strand:+ start:7906 stop:8835 length:930 start_codon:yes stop_codon:yes gene_type:complete
MAVQETRTLPAPFIESLGKDYAKGLTDLTKTPLATAQFAPKVAPQHQLQQDAVTLAQQGLGGYEPYITGQGAYSGLPTDMMGAQDYGAAAAALTGTGAGPATQAGTIASYMSPYQQSVIDATLSEYDIQAQKGQHGIMDAASRIGALGAGRTGVQLGEYQAASDRNRAAIQAGLLQQGYTQGQGARQQDYANQIGLGQYQSGLGSLTPQLVAGQIGTMGQVGATQQAQTQAQYDAMREANRMAAYEPYERMGYYGTGVTGIMGGYPGQYQWSSMPNPTPLQTALGVGATMGGIWGNVMGPQRGMKYNQQ